MAALGGLIFGYDVSVTNGAVAALQDQFRVGNTLLGLAAGAGLLGAAGERLPPGASQTGWVGGR
ncbi:MFS transporter, sugar porter family domain protein [Mycobacterium xenopi 3993]|nr:MFS transporter, sugar porter family domain protein [Mycobacterium xenopi 3993]